MGGVGVGAGELVDYSYIWCSYGTFCIDFLTVYLRAKISFVCKQTQTLSLTEIHVSIVLLN